VRRPNTYQGPTDKLTHEIVRDICGFCTSIENDGDLAKLEKATLAAIGKESK